MTDQEYEQLQKKIEFFFEWWIPVIAPRGWNITPEYFRGTFPNDQFQEATAYPTMMDADPDWRYMNAHIRINVLAIHEHNVPDADIENAVIHELCHLHVCELRAHLPEKKLDEHLDHEERVATQLSRAIQHLRDTVRAEVIKNPEAVA